MIKVIMCLFKKPGISDEEFAKHWKEIHGPMIVKLRPALKKYVQNHLVRIPGVNYQGDGIVEFWFDDPEIEQKLRNGVADYLPRHTEINDDANKFVDASRTIRWIVEEHTMK